MSARAGRPAPPAGAGAGPTSDSVWRIDQVTLAGFGVYSSRARFEFPERAAVFVGENEIGKSTLFHGVAAILYGLDATTDPAAFGSGRFRSFSRPKEFWGEIVWEQGGRRYRLHRAFDSHRVRLTETGHGGDTLLFEGEHNPRARSSAGSAFASLLAERTGLTSRELFLETVGVAQPLPGEAEVGSDLQHLLSGSRSGRLDDVLNRLFEEVRGVTRATGDLGLTKPGKSRAVNQREPGRLEELEEELKRSRDELAKAQELLTELNRNNEALETRQARLRELSLTTTERETRVDKLGRWLDLGAERQTRVEAVQQAEKILQQLNELEARRREAAPDLASRFAPYRDCPADLAARIDRALEAATQREQAGARAEERRAARRSLQERIEAHRSRLEECFRDVRGRDDLLAHHEQLVRAVREREARAAAIAARADELAQSETRAASDPIWTGPDPVPLLPRVESFLADVRRLEQAQGRRAEIDRELEGRRFLAEGGRLESLREKIRREERMRQIRPRVRELELWLEREQKAEEARRAREEAAALAAPAAPAAPRRGPLPIWLTLLCSAGAGALLRLALGRDWTVSVLAALLVLALLLLLDRWLRRPAGNAAAAPAGTTPEPERVGTPADSGAEDRAKRSEELAALLAEQASLEADLPELRKELGPFAETTESELAGMEAKWRAREEELVRLRSDDEAVLARYFPDEGDGWRSRPATDLPEELRESLRLPGAPAGPTCGELAQWLSRLGAPFWTDAAGRAKAARVEEERRRELRAELERLRAEEAAGEEEAKLRSLLAPFDEETTSEELRARVDACREEETGRAVAEERLASIPDEEAIAAELAAADARLQEALAEIRRDWPAAPAASVDGSPRTWLEGLREEERAARAAWAEDASRDEAAQRILEAAGATSVDEIAERLTAAQASLHGYTKEQESLERDDPFFAGVREIGDARERGRRLHEEFDEESRRLAKEKDEAQRLEGEVRDLLRRLAGLEGRAAPNVEQLEIRARRLEAKVVELRREAQAIAQAFRWVQEAAERYQQSYREDLEQRASALFERLTGQVGRRLRLDERFRVTALLPDGQPIAPEQLSQGARDQLVLALRLAVADLLSGSVGLPIFFDDPFLHFDRTRLARLREALDRLAETRQWVLLTHRDDMRDWGEPIRRVS